MQQSIYIEEREKDIKKIEKSVVEVNEIFKNLNTLVFEQDDLVDSISNISQLTNKNVEKS